MEIPTLREIRRLETAAEDLTETSVSQANKAKPQQQYWHPAFGAMFVLGILTMLIGLGLMARYTWRSREIPPEMLAKPTHEQVIAAAPSELFRVNIDEMNFLDSVQIVWEPLSKYEELPGRAKPGHLFLREIRDGFRRNAKWSGIAAAFGLVLAVIPFLFSKKKK